MSKLSVLSVASLMVFSAGCDGLLCNIPFLNLFLPQCRMPDCTTNADCGEGEVCQVSTGDCVECVLDSDCDQGVCSESGGNVCVECVTDANCDDGDECTIDGCDQATCVNVAVDCAEGEVCDPADGACVPLCNDDADCDDGEFCNGAETCDGDGVCQDGSDPCPGDICVETDGECVECVLDDDCGADEVCTDGTCVTSACESDDDCGGDLPVCDTESGDCVECIENADCADGEQCTGNVCEEIPSCEMDEECDDGLFCNGAETCVDMLCVDGTEPCAEDQTCDEDDDECDSPEGINTDLTPDNDTIVGTSGDDVIDGSRDLEFGNFVVTVNNGDNIDTGLGEDTLDAQITGTVTPQALLGLEIFNIELVNNAAATFNLTNADSATTINNLNPQNNLTVSNVQTAPTHFGLTNAGAQDFTVNVASSALSGAADECTLTLNGVTDAGASPVVTLQPSSAGSGYETITCDSSGAIDNSIDDLLDGNGNSFSTLNIMGTRGLTIDQTLATTVTTINGTNASGKLNITLPAANNTFTGGSNNDTVDFATNFDTNDTVTGGDGDDKIKSDQADFVGTTTTQTNVSGVETLETSDAIAGNLNVVHFGAMNATIAGKDGTARTVTIPDGGTIKVTADVAANDLDVALSGTDTTSNAFTLDINGTDAGGGADFTGNVDAGGFELMTLKSGGTGDTGDDSDNDMADITLNSVGGVIETLTVTGATNLDIGGAITAEKIDASAFTGVFDNSDGTVAGQADITTGTGADFVDGSAAADQINSGAGNDRIEGKAGADLLTGDTGNDIFDFDNGDTDEMVADTITDADLGTNSSTNDSFVFDETSLEAVTGITQMTDTSNNDVAAADGTFKQLASDGQTVTDADMVGLIGDYTNAANAFASLTSWTIVYGAALDAADAFLVAYTSGANVRIAVAIAGATANSDGVTSMFDIAILQNVSLSNFDSGDISYEN